ncbi:MAG: hypothetical protein A2600_03570 [Candidatus Lambdaproteobacteria bacterium RIFOXYD1_FULL_56_27]|uniref:Uncharacterized protein n=1 Tax=Candidatus Lambdaproteobacteria bacterium RIFOXYD2_FULL_56_26 TaxID=1817773 RepID=A0A1F6H3C9_9PROT|nr:MAG: hypothetical protein A2426_11630 [Candidatus Lambdaproteobacteria bacterium RIFOXYC1_FULL_56_13]OGH04846.1 MAG: hypothetical protein A2557_07635 [Candidatus Lambdaproteobacteria bacterium RIFOXYD2_FULL_56_26]OGH09311.1 MAG: hypothetical protein A2600_03570 [Candidatus Lambdaproteobacteria bacterium RIFOXYD1_FULL_56_27]
MTQAAPKAPKTRSQTRYDHAYISLKVEVGGQWHWVKALHWNEIGFNFFFPEALATGVELNFKKGLNQFSGKVVWQRQEVNGADLIEMAVNMILMERVMAHQDDLVLVHDVLGMIRRGSSAKEKLSYSAENLDLVITEDHLRQKIAGNHWAELGQVGVESVSSSWAEVVAESLRQSEGILALEQKQVKSIDQLLGGLNQLKG